MGGSSGSVLGSALGITGGLANGVIGAVAGSKAGRTTGGIIDAPKRAREEAERAQAKMDALVRRRKTKEFQQKQTDRFRMLREKQMTMLAAANGGRQSTILGGASSVGNIGNQAQAGSGKTLLGV